MALSPSAGSYLDPGAGGGGGNGDGPAVGFPNPGFSCTGGNSTIGGQGQSMTLGNSKLSIASSSGQSSSVTPLMEGILSKWTNVMKGWQFRWFVLDENTGLLSYYTVSIQSIIQIGFRLSCALYYREYFIGFGKEFMLSSLLLHCSLRKKCDEVYAEVVFDSKELF